MPASSDQRDTDSVAALAVSAWTRENTSETSNRLRRPVRYNRRRLPRHPRVRVVPDVADSCTLPNRCSLEDVAGIEAVSIVPNVNAHWTLWSIVMVMTKKSIAEGWHRECFKCYTCTKGLDSLLCCEGPDKGIYCKVCYAKKYGPRGIGFGGGAIGLTCDISDASEMQPLHTTVLDTSIIKAKPGQGCPRCGGVVFAAELVLSKSREWHRKCFKCRDCHRVLDSIIACDGPDKDVYCKTCYGKKWGPHGYGFANGAGFLQTDGLTEDEISATRPFFNPDTTSIMAASGEGCPRCGGKVFAAEQQLAKGTMWHKKCFNCRQCHRPLDSMLACDGPDKEIYCRACYGKNFGPKGFGYGHAPTLVSTAGESTIQFPDGGPMTGHKAAEGKGCRKCGYEVYAAEQMISKNGLWHKRCFACLECRRSLDSTSLNDAIDGYIYCRGCYARKFGPKGCGFGIGAGALTMA
ncbi:muscle LIM protein Mlp84B isoform X6 [Nilaparvata lugens]|uniref:muscle LIM protein Mlp84B isoform X6 n=1 Tax=Nilaparvata lugens TaxID=108931 RepID=UPI00193EA41D|nr:muscle LIM protein Mlp84B isoform X6 [Nilaparvata lugens]